MEQKKLSTKEVALMLMEALEPFCEELKDLHPALAYPFRQKDGDGRDCVMASNGKVLVAIRAKEAGVAYGGFKTMDEFKAYKALPTVGFEDLLNARTVRRDDLRQVIDQMKQWEDEKQTVASADLCGIQLSMEGLSHIEVAMRICGADLARLVWHKDDKVALQLDNDKRREAVTILHICWKPKDAHVISVPTAADGDSADCRIDWQRGMVEWADIKADLARREEEERMARRKVYLVQMVKIGYIPVYAKNEEEARQLANGEAWFEPEDDGDDEWVLGDEVPEAEDLDNLDDCYEHVITRDGVVERDEIYELEQISEEWQKKHNKQD